MMQRNIYLAVLAGHSAWESCVSRMAPIAIVGAEPRGFTGQQIADIVLHANFMNSTLAEGEMSLTYRPMMEFEPCSDLVCRPAPTFRAGDAKTLGCPGSDDFQARTIH